MQNENKNMEKKLENFGVSPIEKLLKTIISIQKVQEVNKKHFALMNTKKTQNKKGYDTI